MNKTQFDIRYRVLLSAKNRVLKDIVNHHKWATFTNAIVPTRLPAVEDAIDTIHDAIFVENDNGQGAV